MTDREICRIFYITKGHLVDMKTMSACYHSYFVRAWGNHENGVSEAHFEPIYIAWCAQQLEESCVKGVGLTPYVS
mgnify:FL=1|tara:strand:+ start:882 stop:1106 length:225 start_codon:yes stop_codon:yes gene_type:complete